MLRSRSLIFAITQFDDKFLNLQISSIFCAISYRCRYLKILNLLPSKSRSRSRIAIFAITQFDGKRPDLQMYPIHFSASSYRFRDIKIINFLHSKTRPRSLREISQLHNSMVNVKKSTNLSPTHFLR